MKATIRKDIDDIIAFDKEYAKEFSYQPVPDNITTEQLPYYFDLEEICRTTKLSEDFLEYYLKYLNWLDISRCQKLSEKFIRKHQYDVIWSEIFINQDISEKFRNEFKKKIKKQKILKLYDEDYRNEM